MAVIYFRRLKTSEGKVRTIQDLLKKTSLDAAKLRIHVNGRYVVLERYGSRFALMPQINNFGTRTGSVPILPATPSIPAWRC